MVTFDEGRDERGRPRATAVGYVGERRSVPGWVGPASVALLLLGLALVLVADGRLPLVVALAYAVMSVVSFVTYASDKSAARRGAWRVPESTLHLLDLACGWPGGLAARHALRHKTRKQPFRAVFWLTVVANCAALAWLVQR